MLEERRATVDKMLARMRVARKQVRTERASLRELNDRICDLEEAQELAQKVAAECQNIAHAKIAEVVSRCLSAVFEKPYAFKISFERKRGKTEAKLTFERDGLEVDPLTASGGGVVDVAAFALRLACLVLARPPLRRVLVLDEPFRFVSVDLRPRVRHLLEVLSDEMGVQIIMVTHDPQLVAGKVKRLG